MDIFCNNQVTYEEILSWRGFSFEQSRVIASYLPIKTIEGFIFEAENGTYGIEESERIIVNVLAKQRGAIQSTIFNAVRYLQKQSLTIDNTDAIDLLIAGYRAAGKEWAY